VGASWSTLRAPCGDDNVVIVPSATPFIVNVTAKVVMRTLTLWRRGGLIEISRAANAGLILVRPTRPSLPAPINGCACSAGSFVSNNMCFSCPLGTFSVANASSCLPCGPSGTDADFDPSTPCLPCTSNSVGPCLPATQTTTTTTTTTTSTATTTRTTTTTTTVFTNPRTFVFIQVPKIEGLHPFYTTGSTDGYSVRGVTDRVQTLSGARVVNTFVQGGQLLLVRNVTYTFQMQGVTCPLILTTSDQGGQLAERFTAGVTIPSGVSGSQAFDFTPGNSAPNQLYYQCSTAIRMGYIINIVNPASSRFRMNTPFNSIANRLPTFTSDIRSTLANILARYLKMTTSTVLAAITIDRVFDGSIVVDYSVQPDLADSQQLACAMSRAPSFILPGLPSGSYNFSANTETQLASWPGCGGCDCAAVLGESSASETEESSGGGGNLLMYAAAGGGGGALILLIIGVILCRRRRNSRARSADKDGIAMNGLVGNQININTLQLQDIIADGYYGKIRLAVMPVGVLEGGEGVRLSCVR
jgi:hypothetical protein